MKAADLCGYCNMPLTERMKHEGTCPSCGEQWNTVECSDCGEMIDAYFATRNDAGEYLCSDCDLFNDLPF